MLIKELDVVVIDTLGNRSSYALISLVTMDGPAFVPLFTASGAVTTWRTLTVPVRTAACVSLPSNVCSSFLISVVVIFLSLLF